MTRHCIDSDGIQLQLTFLCPQQLHSVPGQLSEKVNYPLWPKASFPSETRVNKASSRGCIFQPNKNKGPKVGKWDCIISGSRVLGGSFVSWLFRRWIEVVPHEYVYWRTPFKQWDLIEIIWHADMLFTIPTRMAQWRMIKSQTWVQQI